MDIVIKQDSRKRKYTNLGIGLLSIALVVFVLYKWFNPSIPTVARDRVYIESVKRGELVRLVRGSGTIVAQEIRFLATQTQGIVKAIHVRPGMSVSPDTVILELDNPELVKTAFDAELEYNSAQDSLEGAKLELEQELMALESGFAQLDRTKSEAELDLEVNEELFAEGLIGKVELKKSKMLAAQLATQVELERRRLEFIEKSNVTQIATKQSELRRAEAKYALFRDQIEALKVRAGIEGVLQRLTIEEGQSIAAATAIAEVADTKRLKAKIRIAESDTRDLAIGQTAFVGVGNAEIRGVVDRIDAAVEEGTVSVEVRFTDALPPGVRTDRTVEGRVQLDRLDDVVYVGKPTMASENRAFTVFRIAEGGDVAMRTNVHFGKGSINTIEVTEGLLPGDRVILSDTSEWDAFDRIRLVGN